MKYMIVPVEHPCELGCKTSCQAVDHGCPSECPALPLHAFLLGAGGRPFDPDEAMRLAQTYAVAATNEALAQESDREDASLEAAGKANVARGALVKYLRGE